MFIRNSVIFIFLCYAMVAPIVVYATFDREVTPKEKAVFAFFRAAYSSPDYEFWITSSPRYKRIPQSQRHTYLTNEMYRLAQAFSDYDIDKELITLKVRAISRYMPATDGERAKISFRFESFPNNAMPTFDFRYGPEYVSLMLDKLKTFSEITLSPEQNKQVQEHVPFEKDDFAIQLEIHTRVKSADAQYPVYEAGKKKWVMIGKIEMIKAESNHEYHNQKLWEYISPWYEAQMKVVDSEKQDDDKKYPHPYDLFKR